MRKLVCFVGVWLNLASSLTSYSQQNPSGEGQTIAAKMAKVRAAKAQKKQDRATSQLYPAPTKSVPATRADYQSPVDKALKGPHGEVVHTGERGGKFYINKNGNKTYLSSNH